MTINELRTKRATLWNTMEGFLDTHRTDKGVLSAEDDTAAVDKEAAGYGVEKGGFARSVGADDGDKLPLFDAQRKVAYGELGVDGAGVKGLTDASQFKHRLHLPCGA